MFAYVYQIPGISHALLGNVKGKETTHLPGYPPSLATCLQMTRAFGKGEFRHICSGKLFNALNAIIEICLSGTINIYE